MSDQDSGSGGTDKGRRRRGRRSYSSRSAEKQNTHGYAMDKSSPFSISCLNLEDIQSLAFLSSPEKCYEVISSFGDIKRRIIESIGFGGLLCLPLVNDLNKPFSLWIMNRIHWFTSALTIGDRLSLTIRPEHIAKITGLNHTGTLINENSVESVDEKLQFIKTKLAFLGADCGIVEAAEIFIQKDFPSVVDKDWIDNFKVAFVIFVMGRFLAPSIDSLDGYTSFWGALLNPDEIHSFNWSSYLLGTIKYAARLVNWAVPSKKPLSIVSGCWLVLKILYLDNIDFGVLNLPHDVFPRWKNFSNDAINAMIEADTCEQSASSRVPVFGRQQSIRYLNSCYWTGSNQTPMNVSGGVAPSASLNQPVHPHTSAEHSKYPIGPHTAHLNTDGPLPTIFKSLPNFDDHVLDFSTYINQRYQGKVDQNLLDDLKLHNSRCLRHLAKSYRALASSIVDENANFAIKFLDKNYTLGSLSANKAVPDKTGQRRRTFKDFVSGTDSSTEGEDNTLHSKMARTRVPVTHNECSNTISTGIVQDAQTASFGNIISTGNTGNATAGGSNTSTLIYGCRQLSRYADGQSAPVSDLPPPIPQPYLLEKTPNTNLAPTRLPEHSIPTTETQHEKKAQQQNIVPTSKACKATTILIDKSSRSNVPYVGLSTHYSKHCVPNVSNDQKDSLPSNPISVSRTPGPFVSDERYHIKRNISPMPLFTSSHAKFSSIHTPEATIKMSTLSPSASPTAENKLYSGACVSIRMLDSMNGIDLNASSFEDEYNSTFQPKLVDGTVLFCSSHWSMNVDHPERDSNIIESFYDWLSHASSNDLERNWIIHSIPRFLKIIGSDLKDQFTMKKAMSFDVFDAAIRRLKQLDKEIYSDHVPLRWRHLLESDYAIHALGAENPAENKYIRDQFIGTVVDYEIASCRMFYVPVYVEGKWWCYAWDLEHSVVYIFDHSSTLKSTEVVIKEHAGTIDSLSIALSATVKDLFIGWSPDFNFSYRAVVRTSQIPYNRCDTGLITLFCIRNFDGTRLVVEPTENNIKCFRSLLLYELMEIKPNTGSIPASFVEILD